MAPRTPRRWSRRRSTRRCASWSPTPRRRATTATSRGAWPMSLGARARAGLPGLVVLPCELIERNGDRLRALVTAAAQARGLEPGVVEHVRDANTWAVTLVDRITTSPAPDVPGTFGDPLAVAVEPFASWVVEAPDGRAHPGARAGGADHGRAALRAAQDPDPQRRPHGARGAHPRHGRDARAGGAGRSRDRGLAGGAACSRRSCPRWASGSWMATAFARTTLERFRNPFQDHRLADIAIHHDQKLAIRLVPTYREHVERFGRRRGCWAWCSHRRECCHEGDRARGAGAVGRPSSCRRPSAPGPGEALVAIRRIGVCGTDLHAFHGRQPFFSYPRILGHELAVEVLAAGSGVTHVRAGDRARAAARPSPAGPATRAGGAWSNCCPRLTVLGAHVDGGMRERIVVAREPPAPVRDAHAGPAGARGAAVHRRPRGGPGGARRGRADAGHRGGADRACGGGAPGRGGRASAGRGRERGAARVRGTLGRRDGTVAPGDDPAATVRDAFDGELPTLVFDATGNAASMHGAFELVAHGGRLVFVGLFQGDVTFHDPDFHRREQTLIASRNATGADFERSIALIEAGGADVLAWITDRATLDGVPEALPRVGDPRLRHHQGARGGVSSAQVQVARPGPRARHPRRAAPRPARTGAGRAGPRPRITAPAGNPARYGGNAGGPARRAAASTSC